MRVLITNLVLWPRTGTSLYVRDLALGLQRRGHQPAVFAPTRGGICDELRRAGVSVVDRTSQLPWRPDVIHGHHHLPLMRALYAFPTTPAIQVCHDHLSPHDEAVLLPAVRRHFAVSELCRQRRRREGVGERTLALLPNFVDLRRFPRRGALASVPRRALVFSNYASDDTYLPAIRRACARQGLTVDVVGTAMGSAVDAPERVLPNYDVVFAKARAAIEAMAVGNAVVLCDFSGLGPLVTSSGVAKLQPLNFGRDALTGTCTTEAVLERLAAYDAADAHRVCDWVRTHATLDAAIERLEQTYRAVVAEALAQPHAPRVSLVGHCAARLSLRLYWGWLTVPPHYRGRLRWLSRCLRVRPSGALERRTPDGEGHFR